MSTDLGTRGSTDVSTDVSTGLPPGARCVGRVEEVPVGEGRAFVVDGVQVAVFRHRDGRLSAVDAVCPHSRGPLADGQIDDAVLVCPLHLNAWNLATGESTGDQPPLRVHQAAAGRDGELFVTLDTPSPQ